MQVPKYLYKILSFRNWQATLNGKVVALSADDRIFIHLSTEDQCERIIAKYWSDAPQYTVLKIDTGMLQGDMRYEVNEGGTTKYYHLYHGFIPIEAIVESRIVFAKPLNIDSSMQHKLDIVQIGDPVLRQKARPLSESEILSEEIQELIHAMKASMRAAPGVGLAAPQVGKDVQLIVVEDMEHSHLTPEQLVERDRVKVPFHVLINPIISIEGTETVEFFEACLSIPLVGIVPRAREIRVVGLDEHANRVEIQAKGWYARILQHEIDHLNGILFIDRARIQSLMTTENYVKLWKEKSISEILTQLSADPIYVP